ncbi:ribonuclease HII [Staphylococcus sp. SS35]|nr:ribonuclease HII [Staphylococcus singaporensis]
MTLTIKEITQVINTINTIEELENHECFLDERKGVQKAITRRRKVLEKERALRQKYIDMSHFENKILSKNPNAIICGIDEVGRGPLAGPVVACATILNPNHNYLGLDDSKKVPVTKRQELNDSLKNNVTAYAFGIATATEIDEFNIYKATQIAMQRAIDGLSVQPTHLLIDAMKLDNALPQESLIKGDARSVSIAAASIMAKVFRDDYMTQLSKEYPAYGFEKNAGYGTKQHLMAIDDIGIMKEHRKSFEPIKSLL